MIRPILSLTPTLTLTLALTAAPLAAAPVQWTEAAGGNGHWYELVSPELLPDFDKAVILAQGRSWAGLGGYLATVTSAAEWDFLNSAVNPGGVTAWLGGSDAGDEGVWRWVDGPEAGQVFWSGGVAVTFAAWNAGEPNNVGDEDYLHGWYGAGWNDIPGDLTYGYVVEYSPIPLPASLPLLGLGLGLGLGALVALRRPARG